MPFILWERNTREVVHTSNAAHLFDSKADAEAWVHRLNQHGADHRVPKPIYDVLKVTVS